MGRGDAEEGVFEEKPVEGRFAGKSFLVGKFENSLKCLRNFWFRLLFPTPSLPLSLSLPASLFSLAFSSLLALCANCITWPFECQEKVEQLVPIEQKCY